MNLSNSPLHLKTELRKANDTIDELRRYIAQLTDAIDARGLSYERRIDELVDYTEELKTALSSVTKELMRERGGGNDERFEELRDAVAAAFGVTVEQLISPSRQHFLTRPRVALYRLAREHLKMAFTRIAVGAGFRDHTTIMSGYRMATRYRASNPEFDRIYRSLERQLGYVQGDEIEDQKLGEVSALQVPQPSVDQAA